MIRAIRKNSTDAIGSRMQGVLQTTCIGMGQFMRAYYGEALGRAAEVVRYSRELFAELRKGGLE